MFINKFYRVTNWVDTDQFEKENQDNIILYADMNTKCVKINCANSKHELDFHLIFDQILFASRLELLDLWCCSHKNFESIESILAKSKNAESNSSLLKSIELGWTEHKWIAEKLPNKKIIQLIENNIDRIDNDNREISSFLNKNIVFNWK